MKDKTTIVLDKKTVGILRDAKSGTRQTYDELLQEMTSVYNHARENNQYDEFLHKIQQPKMQELWDNPEDEEWENV